MELFERIDLRVEQMVDRGLLQVGHSVSGLLSSQLSWRMHPTDRLDGRSQSSRKTCVTLCSTYLNQIRRCFLSRTTGYLPLLLHTSPGTPAASYHLHTGLCGMTWRWFASDMSTTGEGALWRMLIEFVLIALLSSRPTGTCSQAILQFDRGVKCRLLQRLCNRL